jgi:hypothetical protein
MKIYIIDDFIIFYCSHCFSCKHVLIDKTMFLDVSMIQVEKIAWAIDLISRGPSWKWTRTGNARCQRVCRRCMNRRKQAVNSLLTRGYSNSASVLARPQPRTLPEFVKDVGMGRLERVGYQ